MMDPAVVVQSNEKLVVSKGQEPVGWSAVAAVAEAVLSSVAM